MNNTRLLKPIFHSLDALLQNKRMVLVGIDGNSAAGKSTMASIIEKEYECNVFHMDDYFLPAKKKTKKRLNEVGGNFDRERFKKEVINGILTENCITYRKFDCKEQSFSGPISVPSKMLNIIEGVYSMHPDFNALYDLKIFMEINEEEQSRRILSRNGPLLHKRYIEEWIPMENLYFSQFGIKEKSHILIDSFQLKNNLL